TSRSLESNRPTEEIRVWPMPGYREKSPFTLDTKSPGAELSTWRAAPFSKTAYLIELFPMSKTRFMGAKVGELQNIQALFSSFCLYILFLKLYLHPL